MSVKLDFNDEEHLPNLIVDDDASPISTVLTVYPWQLADELI
jgi:hypothetical protein